MNWSPGSASRVLLAGDETAVPAISAVLEALPAHINGHAFLEVPEAADTFPLGTSSGVSITWLERGTAARGVRLEQAVGKALSRPSAQPGYAWVGAEAGTVRALRRCLAGAGLDPRTAELRGYWSLGRAGSGVNGIPVTAPDPGQGPQAGR
ncbi:siderophore-interacting protein [Escherichia coli]|uniref:siderophore-interacting protein n=1 Tax=Escherichia coli TaxID=562 RepID=UPI003D9C0354